LFCGVVTAFPLLLFGRAVRGLRLSTLGVLQYIAPGIQLVLAVAVFGENFQPVHAVGFGCVWAALLWFGVEAVLARRPATSPESPAIAESGTRNSVLEGSTRARMPRESAIAGAVFPQSTLARTE
jgi:hypothetical protein